jgi:nucleoside-diphosphate-sugar epimerase
MDTKPILVTGAGGFVCSEIALALHRAGHAVMATDQHFDAATIARLGDIPRIEGALADVLNGWSVQAPGAVIHGAAITASPERLGISNAAHIARNVDLLTVALGFARDHGAGRFLFLSSMGVFEPDDLPAPGGRFTEATRHSATCTYCAAKSAGELLTHAAREDGFATLSLRLGNIFGPHETVRETRQHVCLVARMIADARDSGVIVLDTPDATREWAWLPDLARGIADLMADFPLDGPSVLHAGSPPSCTDLQVARAIADRIKGTLIRLAPLPHAPVRPPMASDHASAVQANGWTTMSAALDQMIPAEVTA